MQFWLSRGLGFAINHIEVAFDHFFGLRGWPDEWVEFDTAALLRVAYKDRIEALARGVQGGIYAPDEARNAEDLPKTPYRRRAARAAAGRPAVGLGARPPPADAGAGRSSSRAGAGRRSGRRRRRRPDRKGLARAPDEKAAEDDRQAAA